MAPQLSADLSYPEATKFLDALFEGVPDHQYLEIRTLKSGGGGSKKFYGLADLRQQWDSAQQRPALLIALCVTQQRVLGQVFGLGGSKGLHPTVPVSRARGQFTGLAPTPRYIS